MVKNGCWGHFVADNLTQQAQWSAYGRRVAEVTAMIGRTGVDSFLSVFGCRETLNLWDIQNSFSQTHLQMNCSCGESSASYALCQMMVAINVRHQRQLGGMQGIQCDVSVCESVMSTVGAIQWSVNNRKKVKIILLEQYFILVGVLKYQNCSIVHTFFYLMLNLGCLYFICISEPLCYVHHLW